MKFIFLILLAISKISFANSMANTPELMHFNINCVGNSQTSQGTLNVNFNGTISVFYQDQTGMLKLGSIGAFEFTADFKFHLSQKNNGVVTFSLKNSRGFVISKNSLLLPKNGDLQTAIYYFDTATGVAANVLCSVAPVSGTYHF